MKINVCVFGDSIVYGEGDTREGGWAVRLRNYFEEKANNEVDVRIYSLGVRGNTSADLLERIDVESKARKADMVIIAIGTNDASYFQPDGDSKVSYSDFEENIKKIYETARLHTERVVFVGMLPVDESKTMPVPWEVYYEKERIQRYGEVILEFCQKNGLHYVDMSGVLLLEDLDDGLHPNPVGHQKIFERMKTELKSIT